MFAQAALPLLNDMAFQNSSFVKDWAVQSVRQLWVLIRVGDGEVQSRSLIACVAVSNVSCLVHHKGLTHVMSCAKETPYSVITSSLILQDN